MAYRPTVYEEEEHRVWLKEAPYLYDCNVVHSFGSASLTASWLPGCAYGEDGFEVQRLLSGTNCEGEPNYLQVVEVRLPTGEAAEAADPKDMVQIMQRVSHDGQVLAAAHNVSEPTF